VGSTPTRSTNFLKKMASLPPLPTRESTDEVILSANSLRLLATELKDKYLENPGSVLLFLCACRSAFAMFLANEIASELTKAQAAEFWLCIWDHVKDELHCARYHVD